MCVVDNNTIRSFVFDYIRSLPWNIGYGKTRDNLRSIMHKMMPSLLSDNQIKVMAPLSINFYRDTKDQIRMLFKNHIVKITKEGVDILEYEDTDAQVWEKRVIGREVNYSSYQVDELIDLSDFSKFVFLVSGSDMNRMKSLMSIMGYLISGYRNPSETKAVIFMDESLEDGANGRSGKSLLLDAIGKVKCLYEIDGKTNSLQNQFIFGGVSLDTDIIVFDDVRKNFDFGKLFSVITNGIDVNEKGVQAFHIPKEDSPRIAISTNYVMGGIGDSYRARKIEFEFSNYFNADHNPEKEFGRLLFDDWDDNQFNLFYLFMIECVLVYLQNGIIQPKPINIERKKLIYETDIRFVEFMDEYFHQLENKEIKLESIRSNLRDCAPKLADANWLSTQCLKKWIRIYCGYKNAKMTDRRSNNKEVVLIVQNPKS